MAWIVKLRSGSHAGQSREAAIFTDAAPAAFLYLASFQLLWPFEWHGPGLPDGDGPSLPPPAWHQH